MAQIKCDYCGGFIEDTDAYCEHCGAANKNLKRSATGTPQTIEELQDWYRARHLPPEETTRFFIGKDIKEAKAFGIYEKPNGDFVVYKNKADGTRAVRYEGKDEAYAVKELYLRLKEEILNQKNHQIQSTAPARDAHLSSGVPKINYQKEALKSHRGGCLKSILITLGVILAIVFLVKHEEKQEALKPKTLSYYDNGSRIVYYEGRASYDDGTGYYWWSYDTEAAQWLPEYCLYYEDDWPEDFDSENLKDFSEIASNRGLDAEKLNILNDRNYIDAGHHEEPAEGYYVHNGQTYYYLNDAHGAVYGDGDQSGWYLYDDDEWTYYSSCDDNEKLDEELWYTPAACLAGVAYTDWYSFSEGESWTASDFSGTEWYEEREQSDLRYWEYIEQSQAETTRYDDDDDDDWDNDDDWDWDDDDDWNDDWGDWDSDW